MTDWTRAIKNIPLGALEIAICCEITYCLTWKTIGYTRIETVWRPLFISQVRDGMIVARREVFSNEQKIWTSR